MLSKPENGWTQFSLGNFTSRASYLTDIPQKCIKAFTEALRDVTVAIVNFDAEGWEFSLYCFNNISIIYMNDENGEPQEFYIDMGIKEVAREFIEDLERDYLAWQLWNFPRYIKKDYDLSELKELLKGDN